jgi:hypothetical protein
MIENTEEIIEMKLIDFIDFIKTYNLQITIEEKNDKTTFEVLTHLINKINESRQDKYTLRDVSKLINLSTIEIKFLYKKFPEILGHHDNLETFTENDIKKLKIVKYLNKDLKHDTDYIRDMLK